MFHSYYLNKLTSEYDLTTETLVEVVVKSYTTCVQTIRAVLVKVRSSFSYGGTEKV